jgi:hypothetical protein
MAWERSKIYNAFPFCHLGPIPCVTLEHSRSFVVHFTRHVMPILPAVVRELATVELVEPEYGRGGGVMRHPGNVDHRQDAF